MNLEADTKSDRPAIRFHDELAAKWEGIHRSSVFKSRTAAMFSLLDRIQPIGSSWLDAGCGTGTLARILAGRGIDVQGIDGSSTMIDIAIRLSASQATSGKLSFRQVETIETTPFDTATFDGVLCASVLEYTESPERCLSEFRRVLRANGLLLISIPNRDSMLRRLYKWLLPIARRLTSRPVLRYLEFSRFEASVAEATALLQRCGFTVLGHNFAGTPLPKILDQHKAFGMLINIVARQDGGRA